jgi:hypothetical protein
LLVVAQSFVGYSGFGSSVQLASRLDSRSGFHRVIFFVTFTATFLSTAGYTLIGGAAGSFAALGHYHFQKIEGE